MTLTFIVFERDEVDFSKIVAMDKGISADV
jgi:hypothetical protein